MNVFKYKIVEIYKKNLIVKNYSKNTIDTYVGYVDKFLNDMNKNPYHLTTKELLY